MHIGVLGPMSIDLLPLGGAPELADIPGYPAPIVSGIVRGYLEQGARVTAITTSTGLSDSIIVRSGALTLAVVPRARARSALRMFREERQSIMRVLEQDTPDVLHAHWTYEFAAAAQDTGIPTLVTAHDDARTILRFQPTLYRLLRLLLSDRVLKMAPFVSTPSEYLAATIAPRCAGSMAVIPNFIGEDVSLRDSASVPRGQVVVTVSNGFAARKNVMAGLLAFAPSQTAQSGWEYELIGHGLGPGGEAEQWAKQRGLERGVRFRGPLAYEETLSAMTRAAIMIHPALEESFGMTVLEAMALGTPVIGGADSGNIPALLSGGCGVLCDVRAPESIARALDDLAKRPDQRAGVATLARARAMSEYSSDRVIGRYAEALSAILAAPGSKEARA